MKSHQNAKNVKNIKVFYNKRIKYKNLCMFNESNKFKVNFRLYHLTSIVFKIEEMSTIISHFEI